MRDPFEGRFEARRALLVVLLVVAGVVAVGVLNPTALGTIGVLVGIILMIMIHEAGHFVTAKWSDMKVTEFFVGFGPRLWSRRSGETEYGVKAIPAGGYVRIIGMSNIEEVDPADEERTFRSKPYRSRLLVAVAGSFTHFVMAILGLFVIFAALGTPEAQPIVGEVIEDTPAQRVGLRADDRIVAVDGEPVEAWEDVPERVQPRAGERIVLSVERGGEVVEVPVVPEAVESDGEEIGVVGFRPRVDDVTRPLPAAAVDSFTETGSIVKQSVLAVGRFFTPSNLERYTSALTGAEEPAEDTRFLSPVGATQVASQAVEEGVREVLLFLVLINIFVGTLNMFPLPPLDGGHVAVATYEKVASTVTGRPVRADMAKIMPVAALVVMVLLFIGISALWLDIVRPIDVGF